MFTCEEMENEGRKKLTSFLKWRGFDEIYPTYDKYDALDMYGVSPNGKAVVFEIKVRTKLENKYGVPYKDLILEPKKRNDLLKAVEEYELNGGYYASFYENTLWLFDVSDVPFTANTMPMPHHSTGTTHPIIQKEVYHIAFDNAWVFTATDLENNEWVCTHTPNYRRRKNETTNTKEKTNQKG